MTDKKEDKPYAWAGDVFQYVGLKIPEESVEELFESVEKLEVFLKAWPYQDRELAVTQGARTNKDVDGLQPLSVYFYDFRASEHPVALIQRVFGKISVDYMHPDYKEDRVKFMLWIIPHLHAALPLYNPDAVSAPMGFISQTTGYIEKMPPQKTETPQ